MSHLPKYHFCRDPSLGVSSNIRPSQSLLGELGRSAHTGRRYPAEELNTQSAPLGLDSRGALVSSTGITWKYKNTSHLHQ